MVLESQVHVYILGCVIVITHSIIVKSFLELVPILLNIDGVCAFLSEKLS